MESLQKSMLKVVIVGAGGHGQVVADSLLAELMDDSKDIQLVGFVDDNPRLQQCSLLGLPVLGTVAQLPTIVHHAVVIAIGNNQVRHKIYRQLHEQGEQFISVYHPSTIIGRGVEIGGGVMISAGVVVNTGALIGQNVILNTGCTVDHHNHIGDHVHIAPGVHIGGDVEIDEGALIGIGATVMPQCRIGAWSIVGAGAVVTRDVPAYSTVVGIPARIIKVSQGVFKS